MFLDDLAGPGLDAVDTLAHVFRMDRHQTDLLGPWHAFLQKVLDETVDAAFMVDLPVEVRRQSDVDFTAFPVAAEGVLAEEGIFGCDAHCQVVCKLGQVFHPEIPVEGLDPGFVGFEIFCEQFLDGQKVSCPEDLIEMDEDLQGLSFLVHQGFHIVSFFELLLHPGLQMEAVDEAGPFIVHNTPILIIP